MKKTITLFLTGALFSSFSFGQLLSTSPSNFMKAPVAATQAGYISSKSTAKTTQSVTANKSSVGVFAPVCDTVNWTYTKGSNPWTPYGWYIGGGTVGQYGWINGVNQNNDKEKAMFFDATSTPINYMTGCFIDFGLAYTTTPNKIVPIKVYDATGTLGAPGALLYTENITMATIMNNTNNNYFTRVMFTSPVLIPANKKFFVSVDLTNLNWATAKDTLSITGNNNGETIPSAVWEKTSTNAWKHYGTTGTWALDISLYIFPFSTSYITGSYQDSICPGGSTVITLSGGYNNDYTWSPATGLNTTSGGTVTASPSVTTNYTVTGSNINGCTFIGVAPVIVVNVNANAGANKNVCINNTITSITATGGTSYSWNTGATGATISVSPTATTNYTVTVTNTFGCSKTTSVSVIVNPLPLIATGADKTICINASTILVASGGSSYSWTPSTGLSCTNCPNPTANPTVTTTYTVTGTDAKSCVNVDTITVNVISCTGINEALNGLGSFDIYPNPNDGHFVLSFEAISKDNYTVEVKNTLGQVVYSEKVSEFSGKYSKELNLNGLSKGVYLVSIANSKNESVRRVTLF